jgi:hypothetical protein
MKRKNLIFVAILKASAKKIRIWIHNPVCKENTRICLPIYIKLQQYFFFIKGDIKKNCGVNFLDLQYHTRDQKRSHIHTVMACWYVQHEERFPNIGKNSGMFILL